VPTSLELSDTYVNLEYLNTSYNVTSDQYIEKNISGISINLNEANSSTPKVQFNIGDTANHPVATITPLESEVDSGFISSEAVTVPELSKGLIDFPTSVQIADNEDEEVNNIFEYDIKIIK